MLTPFAPNALLTGKKLLAKIATKEQKPTVFCPCLTACYMFLTPLIKLKKTITENTKMLNLFLRSPRTSQKIKKAKKSEIKKLIAAGYTSSM